MRPTHRLPHGFSLLNMTFSICIQLAIVLSLLFACRHRLEDGLPTFCFFLVLMPLEAQIPLPGLFDLTIMRISLVSLLSLYLIRGEPGSGDPLPLKYLMLLHVIWAAMSTFCSLSPMTSFKQLLSQVMEFYLLYFLLTRIITRVETIHKILFAVAMAMCLCCTFAVIEVFEKWSILRIFPPSEWITYNGGLNPIFIEWGRGLRVRSTFPHPILFGNALAMSIPITLYLLSLWQQRWKRILLWLGLVLMVWSLYKTSSRGPWIASGLCCLLLFLLIKGSVRKYLLWVSFAAVLIMAARPEIWSSIDGLYTATTDTTSPTGTSYLYRDALNHAVREAVSRNIERASLGYGLGTFRERGLEINFLGRVHLWRTCDNNWAAFLYETGYGGLLIIGTLLANALWIAWRNYRTLPEPDNLLDGVLFTCIAGFYFMLLSVAAYSWGQPGYYLWILISLSVSHSRIDLVEDAGHKSDEQLPNTEEEHEFLAA